MKYLIFSLLGAYAFFQTSYYIKYKYKKEIIIFTFLFSTSILYLYFHFQDRYLSQPTDWLIFIYEPIVEIFFDHIMSH